MSDAPESIGPYKVEERIARGPLGRMLRATEASSGRTVAVKTMPRNLARNPEGLERFYSELEPIAELDHPNVARIVDHGQDGDIVYYVIEYGSETPLGQVLRQRRLTLPEAFAIFKGVALGLQAAHRKGIIHRDLHPANILVSPDLATIRVADFGISSAAEESKADGTATSMTTKTLHYLAPEQIGKEGRCDEQSDIYSLGVLFYEMLTGRVPIGQFNLPSRINAELPAELDPVILKCLEGDPSARYSSVSELLQEIERLEDRLRFKLVSELQGIGRTFSRPTSHILKHRKILLIGLLGIAILAAIVLGARYWLSRTPTEDAKVAATPPPIERPAGSPQVVGDDLVPLEDEGEAAQHPPAGVEATPSESLTGSSGGTVAGTKGPGTAKEGEGTPPAEAEVDAEPEAAVDERGPSPQALASGFLRSAQAGARDGRLDEALSNIERVLTTYPDSDVAIEALFLRARIEESRDRHDDAMDTYSEIGTQHEEPNVRAKARYRFGRTALESNLPNRNQLALGVFDEIPRAFPGTEYAPLALASKAAIEENEKIRFDSPEFGRKVPASFLTSIQIVEEYPDSSAAERAFWLVGNEYEDLKLWDRSADAFWQLGTRFPDTKLDAWWKAGQILDRRLDDKERALEAYQRVPSFSPHAEDAQKRIGRLAN